MCRDQNLISETNERTTERTSERMKIEKPGVGRPLLGPANTTLCIEQPWLHPSCQIYRFGNMQVKLSLMCDSILDKDRSAERVISKTWQLMLLYYVKTFQTPKTILACWTGKKYCLYSTTIQWTKLRCFCFLSGNLTITFV